MASVRTGSLPVLARFQVMVTFCPEMNEPVTFKPVTARCGEKTAVAVLGLLSCPVPRAFYSNRAFPGVWRARGGGAAGAAGGPAAGEDDGVVLVFVPQAGVVPPRARRRSAAGFLQPPMHRRGRPGQRHRSGGHGYLIDLEVRVGRQR